MDTLHTPGPWTYAGLLVVADRDGHPIARLASTRGKYEYEEANAERIVQCVNAHDELVDIVRRLTLATDEGDDKARGTHYIDEAGVIRCKGSFLELIENARAAIAKATGEQA